MMKKITQLLIVLFVTTTIAQDDLNDLLAAGIEDAKRFSTSYLLPATDGLAYGINNGWANNENVLR